MHLAEVFKPPVSAWIAALIATWRKVFFLAPTITAFDAVLLSLFSFLVMNSVNASSRPRGRIPFAPLLLVVVASVFALIFASTILDAASHVEGFIIETYVKTGLPNALFEAVLGLVPEVQGWLNFLFYFLSLFVGVFLVPLLAAVVAIALLDYALGVRFNLAAFTVRMWKILLCFAVLVGLNYLVLWWEQASSKPPCFFNEAFLLCS